jgi:hypothetical protein
MTIKRLNGQSRKLLEGVNAEGLQRRLRAEVDTAWTRQNPSSPVVKLDYRFDNLRLGFGMVGSPQSYLTWEAFYPNDSNEFPNMQQRELICLITHIKSYSALEEVGLQGSTRVSYRNLETHPPFFEYLAEVGIGEGMKVDECVDLLIHRAEREGLVFAHPYRDA